MDSQLRRAFVPVDHHLTTQWFAPSYRGQLPKVDESVGVQSVEEQAQLSETQMDVVAGIW